MDLPGKLAFDEQVQRVVFERLVKGEDREVLLTGLLRRIKYSEALAMIEAAEARIAAARAGSRFEAIQVEVASRREPRNVVIPRLATTFMLVWAVVCLLNYRTVPDHLIVMIAPLVGAGLAFVVFARRP
jgi:hypothetical protein